MGQANEAGPAIQIVRSAARPAGISDAFTPHMAANTTSKILRQRSLRACNRAAQVPEDIDFDPQRKRFFISTVLGQQILQVDMSGRMKVFAEAPDQWPMMALKVDSAAAAAVGDRSGLGRLRIRREGRLGAIRDPAIRPAFRKTAAPYRRTAQGCVGRHGTGSRTAIALVSDGEHGGVYRVNRGSLARSNASMPAISSRRKRRPRCRTANTFWCRTMYAALACWTSIPSR